MSLPSRVSVMISRETTVLKGFPKRLRKSALVTSARAGRRMYRRGKRLCLERVSLSGIYLRHAEDQMFLSHSKFKQYAKLLAIRHGYTPKESDYLLNEDIRDPSLTEQ
jgi:hypothetical protein